MEVTVQDLAEELKSNHPPRLLDIREQAEWEIVHLPDAQLISRPLLEEIVETWAPDTPIVCYCHHGVRSLNAVAFFRQNGFTNVRSMRGGIDAWSREIDPSLPRY